MPHDLCDCLHAPPVERDNSCFSCGGQRGPALQVGRADLRPGGIQFCTPEESVRVDRAYAMEMAARITFTPPPGSTKLYRVSVRTGFIDTSRKPKGWK